MDILRPFVRMLEAREVLSERDRSIIGGMVLREQRYHRGQEIVRAGSRPSESCVLLDGLAGREMVTAEGKRQISALHIAGDFVDLHSYVLRIMDHAVIALTEVTVAFIPHAEIRRAIEASPNLGRIFWMLTAIDGAIQRAWIACLGRSTALQHMAHLFCELRTRMEAVGLTSGRDFLFGVTQAELADVVGLSAVHVNRTLQELRALGLLDWDGQRVRIHDFARLAKLADFDPAYLTIAETSR